MFVCRCLVQQLLQATTKSGPKQRTLSLLPILLLATRACRTAAAAHPCEAAANEAGGAPAFSSLCAAPGAPPAVPAGSRVSAFACLRSDVASRQADGDSFLGRFVRTSWDQTEGPSGGELFVVEWADAAQAVGGYACTSGFVGGLDAGGYALVVFRDYEDNLWNAPWNASVPGSSFGEPVGGFAPPREEPLPCAETLVVVGATPLAHAKCEDRWAGRWIGGRYTPMHCAMDDVSYGEFDACLEALGARVALLGDSNARRTMKLLRTRGAWCSDRTEARKDYCVCEDCVFCACSAARRPHCSAPPHLTPSMPGTQDQHQEAHMRMPPEAWGLLPLPNGSSLEFVGWTGGPPPLPTPTAAHNVYILAGLGAWPLARDDPSEFASTLDGLLAGLDPKSTHIFRTAPYSCCVVKDVHRRYTSKRASLFRAIFLWRVRAWATRTGARPLMWDTTVVSETRHLGDIARQSSRCESNHLDSRLAEEDARLLRHLVCNLPGARRGAARRGQPHGG